MIPVLYKIVKLSTFFLLTEVWALSPAVVDSSSASVKSKSTYTFEESCTLKKKFKKKKDDQSETKPQQNKNRLSGQPVS